MTSFSFEEAVAPDKSGATTFSFEEATKPAEQPKKAMSVTDLNPMTSPGAAEGVLSLASGAVAAPVAGWSGMAAAFAKALGISDTEGADVVRKVQEALTYQPRSEIGQKVVSTAAAPFEALANVADKAGDKMADAAKNPAVSATLRANPLTAPFADNPEAAGAAANTVIQALPVALGGVETGAATGAAAAARGAGRSLMQSALKPTLEQLRTGKGERAVTTMLDEGVNVTKGGVEELTSRVDDLNDKIKNLIAQSPATIDKQRVGSYVQGTLDKFRKQVNATDDVKAIQKSWDEFLNDPNIPNNIPVSQAQELKQGTYRSLGDKSYGELKTADLEAQKALARGLKEEIARAVPEVRALNAEESSYLNALSVAERRVLMDANKNPAGLGWLTTSPEKFALWMADRSPLFKSLIARMTYSAAEPLETVMRSSSAAAAAGGPVTAADRERRRRAAELRGSLGQ